MCPQRGRKLIEEIQQIRKTGRGGILIEEENRKKRHEPVQI
jgi:hypothetical protein